MSAGIRLALTVLLAAPLAGAPGAGDNLLVLVADDVGIDRVGAYGEHPDPGRTPNIDRLARAGVLFRNCWTNPICSASRATMITGRYSFRTGVGWYFKEKGKQVGLSLDEWTLPEVISIGTRGAYRSACLGKWHLRGNDHPITHPNDSGFEHYAGSLGNLIHGGGWGKNSYFHWKKVTDGEQSVVDAYATSVTVDDTLRVIERFGDQPWLVWVGFNAAHRPFHAPPDELHDFRLSGDPEDTPIEHHKAIVQAMDTEIGRLLAGIAPDVLARTTIVFVGDNGTHKEATQPPWPAGHGKGSLFEGGVNVPLIITGCGVSAGGGECWALVNACDLFATLCQLAGVNPRAVVPLDVPLDSASLVPYLSAPELPSRRVFAFAEKFQRQPAGPLNLMQRTVTDGRFKLIHDELLGTERLFDLSQDRFEQNDLLQQPTTDHVRAAWRDLRRRLRALLDTED